MKSIAIIGLGLIGGSLGLALKRAKGKGVEIVGFDIDAGVQSKARQLRAIDKSAPDLGSAAQKANLVIIATPVAAIKEILGQIAQFLPPGCVVTDTASTKEQVMEWAQELLPPTASFIGGHPVAGKDASGIEAADANLFRGCTYCLILPSKAEPKATEMVRDLVEQIGARPFYIGAAEHDVLVAGVNSLPLILSHALVSTVSGNPSWDDMSKLTSAHFRQLCRVALADTEMSMDMCLTNQANIMRWLDEYIKELGRYRRLIAEGNAALNEALAKASELPETGERTEERDSSDVPGAGEFFATWFLGERVARSARLLRRKRS